MVDREKVINGLCEAIGIIHGYIPKRYWGYAEQACRDALELLKEQEAVKPCAQGDGSWLCNNCGETIGWEEMECYGIRAVKYKYCPECGRAAKWDG